LNEAEVNPVRNPREALFLTGSIMIWNLFWDGMKKVFKRLVD